MTTHVEWYETWVMIDSVTDFDLSNAQFDEWCDLTWSKGANWYELGRYLRDEAGMNFKVGDIVRTSDFEKGEPRWSRVAAITRKECRGLIGTVVEVHRNSYTVRFSPEVIAEFNAEELKKQ